ncbi:MAG: MurR/RpiR family transcriptional regulator [Beijerinckiaceae bacterium]
MSIEFPDNPTHLTLDGLVLDLQSRSEALGPAGKKVASYFVENASRLPELTITDIARAVGVSEPTVGRICQLLGFTGFRDFRIKIARAAGAQLRHIEADVAADDQPSDIAFKVIETAMQTLNRLKDQIRGHSVAAAVAILADAQRIEIYGQGNSGLVAHDAQHKFFRLGKPAIAYNDSHVHVMSASLLTPQDSVICISRSGRTRELLRTAEILKERGVPMVSIAPEGSPLALRARVNLHVTFDDDPDVYTPMSSRLAQLTVIDILAVSIAVQRGALSSPDMARARAELAGKRLPQRQQIKP